MCVRCSEPYGNCSEGLLSFDATECNGYPNIPVREYLAAVLPGLDHRSIQREAQLTPMVWTTQASCHIVTARRLAVYFVTATLTE